MMKKIVFLQILFCCLAFMIGQENNDFYDNTPAKVLAGSLKIEVAGEVGNPGIVDLRKLPRRSLITRETRFENGELHFTGSYRYDGVSLFDIVKEKFVAKKNQSEFPPVVDLLVRVENAVGEYVLFSWGEIFYPTVLHRILIADRVSPIIPTESRDEWPLPEKTKVVCGNDMVTERNISEPVKITVFSAPHSFKTVKGLNPLYSPGFSLQYNGKTENILAIAGERRVFPTVFYGRGRGFHGIQKFDGVLLRDVLKNIFPWDAGQIRHGVFTIAASDGYRISVTYSELFNRNDHAEFLLVDRGRGQNGGRFSLYPAGDFFSDRAVKAVNELIYETY